MGVGFLLDRLERADPNGENGGIQRALDVFGATVVYVNFVVGAISGSPLGVSSTMQRAALM